MTHQSRRAPGYLLAALAAGLITASVAGCDVPAAAGPDEFGVCLDQATGVRMDPSYCTPNQAVYSMDYYDEDDYPNLVVVPVGARMVWPSRYRPVHVAPRNTTVIVNLPRSGGTSSGIRTKLPTTSGSGSKTVSTGKTGSSTGASGSSGSSSITRGGLGVKGSSSSTGSSGRFSAGS